MPFKKFRINELGVGQLAILLVLLAAVGLGTYLVQQKTNLLPKAAEKGVCRDDPMGQDDPGHPNKNFSQYVTLEDYCKEGAKWSFKWKADCSKKCTDFQNHSDCDGGLDGKKWCWGFDVNGTVEGRCLKLTDEGAGLSNLCKSDGTPTVDKSGPAYNPQNNSSNSSSGSTTSDGNTMDKFGCPSTQPPAAAKSKAGDAADKAGTDPLAQAKAAYQAMLSETSNEGWAGIAFAQSYMFAAARVDLKNTNLGAKDWATVAANDRITKAVSELDTYLKSIGKSVSGLTNSCTTLTRSPFYDDPQVQGQKDAAKTIVTNFKKDYEEKALHVFKGSAGYSGDLKAAADVANTELGKALTELDKCTSTDNACVGTAKTFFDRAKVAAWLSAFYAIQSNYKQICTKADLGLTPTISAQVKETTQGSQRVHLCSGENGSERKWRWFDTSNKAQEFADNPALISNASTSQYSTEMKDHIIRAEKAVLGEQKTKFGSETVVASSSCKSPVCTSTQKCYEIVDASQAKSYECR